MWSTHGRVASARSTSVGQQKVFKFNPLEQVQPGIVGAVEVEGNSGVGRREGQTAAE